MTPAVSVVGRIFVTMYIEIDMTERAAVMMLLMVIFWTRDSLWGFDIIIY